MQSRAGEVAGLRHWDQGQLAYQHAEIVQGRAYLQKGIEVRPGDVVFDVGANAGVASVFFAGACEARAVYSFEPVAPLFELLRENVTNYPACRAYPYGLGSEAATAEITFYPTAASMSSLHADRERDLARLRRAVVDAGLPAAAADARVQGLRAEVIECELRRLSDERRRLGVEHIDLLKVDVEGSELDVLAGIDDGDWPRIGQLVVEVHEDEDVAVIGELLSDRDYELAWESGEEIRVPGARLLFARRPDRR